MITSISYLPNSVSTAVAGQAQADAGSQSAIASPQNQVSGSVVQLSVYGQVKSSLADLQDKATALKHINQPPTFSDFQAVVHSFVQSFNSLSKTVNDAKQAMLEPDNRIRQTLNEMRKATFGGTQSSAFAMQSLGIAQQANGTLAINQKQLAKDFQENRPEAVTTLVDLSNRISITVNKPLSDYRGTAVNEPVVQAGAFGAVKGGLETPKSPSSVQLAAGSVARTAVVAYAGAAAL